MAYALVLSSDVPDGNKTAQTFEKIINIFWPFFPAPVQVSFEEIDDGLFLYIITMPHPEIYRSKNRTGRKHTLKKWMSSIDRNNIEHYLLEPLLKEYISGEWIRDENEYIAESIRRNIHLLFASEPLKGLELQTMTVTLSGAGKQYIRPNLISVLRNFRMVNFIISDDVPEDTWDEFMAETGVPVCITDDLAVLSRSDVWISYDKNDVDFPFDGIKISACAKNIVCPKHKKKYRIGYVFRRKLLKKLGTALVQRFDNQLLAEFLLNMIIKRKGIPITEAEELLGVRIAVLSAESQGLYS